MLRMRRTLAALLSLLLTVGLLPAGASAQVAPTVGATVAGLGRAPALGAPADARVVSMAPTRSGEGYWVATADGGVFTYGDARFHGSAGGGPLNQPVVDMEPTPTGRGYWLLGADGGVFTYGDARFFGSTGGMVLNQPVVALMPTPTGRGYWLVARDGGIFTFGDAAFHGSAGAVRLNAPIVDAAATDDGDGYLLVASDGAVLTYGDATFHGSAGGSVLAAPVTSVARTPSGDGYWLLGADGGLFTYGDAGFHGTPVVPAGQRAVDVAARPSGDGLWVATGTGPRRPSVGPPLPADSGTGRRVVYSNSGQRVWLVGEDEAVEHSYAVSGRQGVPRPGTYRVWSRSPVAWAGHDGITMRLMVRFAYGAGGGNIGFHTIPEYPGGRPLQTPEELGRYRSAGCVRQGEADARIMWDWAQLGTTVVVLP